MLSPGQDEDAEASRWQEDTKVTALQKDDKINLAKKQTISIICNTFYNQDDTKSTVLQTDDPINPKKYFNHFQQRIHQGDRSADGRHYGPDDGGDRGGLGARGE